MTAACTARCLVVALILIFPRAAGAQGRLLYLEAQAVAGYSSVQDGAVFYSLSREDVMQKPSLGFDYLQRLSGEFRDVGVMALQVRLAYSYEPEGELELQVYNAYFRYKAGFADLWIGHDRPALGLSSYFDSHALLLPTLAMTGLGFERDWGAGIHRDTGWGDVSFSLTSGSGMPLHFKGNHLVSLRASRGILTRDNYNLGLSAAYGKILETMGYELARPDPSSFRSVSIDGSYLWTRFESRVELVAGERMDREIQALFWRFGMNLLEENRLKLEVQPVRWREGETSNSIISAGLTYQLTVDLTLRGMYRYSEQSSDSAIIGQVYYYKGM